MHSMLKQVEMEAKPDRLAQPVQVGQTVQMELVDKQEQQVQPGRMVHLDQRELKDLQVQPVLQELE